MFQNNTQNNQVRQGGFLENWGRLIITVIGGGTVFLATNKELLEMPGPNGQQQGAQFTQVNTSPPKDVPWVGEFWVFVQGAGTMVDIQVPTKQLGRLANYGT